MPDDRDVLRPRPTPASVRAQSAAPEVELEDPTGKYEGEQLAEMRAKRPTDKRIVHLEDRGDVQDRRHEALATVVNNTALAVAKIEGHLDGQDKLLDEIRIAVHAGAQREHVTFKAQVEVDTARAKADISDGLDARKTRRKYIAKIVTGVIGILFSGGLIHYLIGKL